ncbi:facilitated trehalose transporter Tret1 isoform X1 [Nilaparvata lugens]|uniref:facilitated trehalose transporter Tret1 isoform X1 n=2 Tax=Nilaparvata lugens TaxID=108931 RepID=UPI00193D2263|nr:facilitated trehalose transporter Tret1 isoform X1 [Nilaparvata lugens]
MEQMRIEQSQPFVSQEEIREEEEGDEGEENSIERKIDLSAVAITSVKERRKPPLKEEEAKCAIKKAERKGLIAQSITNAVVIVLVTSCGMPIGYSAVLLPQLQSTNSTLPTDDEWASWIASVHSIATPIGAILAGPMMDNWGRRLTLQLSLIPVIFGWLSMSVWPNHFLLLIGRVLGGFSVGMGLGTSQVLIGEISEPTLRGFFMSTPGAAYALGILLVYALGSRLHWRLVACFGLVLPSIAAVALLFLPESPVWLVNKDRADDARKSLLWLRGGHQAKVNHELHMLIGHSKTERDKEEALKQETRDVTCAPVPRWWHIMTRPQVFKPFFILLTFCLLQILTGSYVAIFYGVTLIASASNTPSQEYDCLSIAVMTALVRFVVSIITSWCLLRHGRRRIGLISGVGTAMATSCLVAFLYYKSLPGVQPLPNTRDTKIIAGLIMVYVAMNTFGIFSLPCLMIGEVSHSLETNIGGPSSVKA